MPRTPSTTDSIPCHICGTDVASGWVHGYASSPGALKMGLCHLHDTPANRCLATEAWQERMREELDRPAPGGAEKNVGPIRWRLEVKFLEQGSVVLQCLSCASDDNTLQVELPDKSLTFFPLRQIREYTLRPLPPFSEENAAVLPGAATFPSGRLK